jgi:hypothetical protein
VEIDAADQLEPQESGEQEDVQVGEQVARRHGIAPSGRSAAAAPGRRTRPS